MVSYFVPRGRFLIKAGNSLRNSACSKHQQQQKQQGKWPILLHFRQSSDKTPTLNQPNQKQNTIATKFGIPKTLEKQIEKGKSNPRKQEVILRPQISRNIWLKLTRFLRWAPIGFCVFGAIEWQLHKRKCQQDQVPRRASEFQTKIYCSLPLRLISRCWGWLAACYIPTALRPYLYGWYSSVFNVNIEEALYSDYKHYNSLAEFFTRPLCEGARYIDPNVALVSPADGTVLHFGSATNSLIEQVKGVNYSIQSFLGPPPTNTIAQSKHKITTTERDNDDYAEAIKEKNGDSTALYQCVIYLAPGDYHRFHSPVEWKPTLRRHFAGELLSVNPRIASWLPDLFCLNERALYMGKWEHGFFSYTAVGATNVGSVQIYADSKLKTNRWVGFNVGAHHKKGEYDEMQMPETVKWKKGDLVGQFNMGSTIVLLFEAPKDFKFNIEAGQKIRVGEPLGHIVNQ